MIRYRAYGLEVSSDHEIPALVSGGASTRPLADVALISADIDTSNLTFAPLEEAGPEHDAWVSYAWNAERTVIRFPGVTAEFDVGMRQILVDDSSTDEKYAEHVVLDHVLPRWLSLGGDLVLHGSAVATPNGGAIAFIGDTGLGKSTTATGLALTHDWSLLTDDVCRVIDDDGLRVVPSYPGVRLTPQSRAELAPDSISTPLQKGSEKGRVCPDINRANEPAPLRMIVELGSANEEISFRRLGLAEATAALVRNTFHQARTLSEIASQGFRLASGVVAVVPCYHMSSLESGPSSTTWRIFWSPWCDHGPFTG